MEVARLIRRKLWGWNVEVVGEDNAVVMEGMAIPAGDNAIVAGRGRYVSGESIAYGEPSDECVIVN